MCQNQINLCGCIICYPLGFPTHFSGMLPYVPYNTGQATHCKIRWNQILDFVQDGQVFFGFQSFNDNLNRKKTRIQGHVSL